MFKAPHVCQPVDQGVYSCHLHHHYCGLHERREFQVTVQPPTESREPVKALPAEEKGNKRTEHVFYQSVGLSSHVYGAGRKKHLFFYFPLVLPRLILTMSPRLTKEQQQRENPTSLYKFLLASWGKGLYFLAPSADLTPDFWNHKHTHVHPLLSKSSSASYTIIGFCSFLTSNQDPEIMGVGKYFLKTSHF